MLLSGYEDGGSSLLTPGRDAIEPMCVVQCIVGGGLAVRGIFEGAAALFGLGGATQPSGLVTVGRWMSTEEYALMTNTGRLVESNLGGVTSVSFPASVTAYTNAAAGSVYAEFRIAADALRAVGNGWGKIYGPSSIFGPRLGIKEMPRVVDPVIKATKP